MRKPIRFLADIFRGLHMVVGITALPPDATPEQERNFVLMWIGILVGVMAWCAFLVYLIS